MISKVSMRLILGFLLLLFVPILIKAQSEKGIDFKYNLSWDEVLEKAKFENKYVFVDCFSSWCLPCKKMEKDVYSDEKVGKYLNANFISIKLQLDSTNKDPEYIKKMYGFSRAFSMKYKISAFPTFLFFAPNGKVLHRDQGYKASGDFIETCQAAMNPQKQYYTLRDDYLNNVKRNYSLFPYLAVSAKRLDEKSLANDIAKEYINNYLFSLNIDDLLVKDNIQFVASFIEASNTRYFQLFYKHGSKIDSIMNKKKYSQRVLDLIITKEEIDSPLSLASKRGVEPNWSGIFKNIKRKYTNDFAERNIINAKVKWYGNKQNWSLLIKYAILQVDKYVDTTSWIQDVYRNNIAWEVIFLHSKNRKYLNIAVDWMHGILRRDSTLNNNNAQNEKYLLATHFDTYANLLYKMGKRKEALIMEEKAYNLDSKDMSYKENAEKMRRGEPTWLE